jgi:NADH-quinone oxidoreductase subunit C
MTPEAISQKLAAEGYEVTYQDTQPDAHIEVPRESLREIAKVLRDHPDLALDSLMCLSGLDWPEYYEVAIQLLSYTHRHRLTIKIRCPKEDAKIPTVSDIWPIAEWHEREAYDLVGIHFEGHPDLRRILCPEDWEGHPLRKDYVPQEKWHDIPLTQEPPSSRDEGN